MRARPTALALLLLASCASTTASRPPESPAAQARPEPDPALLGAPAGPPLPLPIEQVAVRARRLEEGRFTIVEFLSPGLKEADQLALRLALEKGELRLANEPASGEESWITTLLRSR
jgi:hypothetical protein